MSPKAKAQDDMPNPAVVPEPETPAARAYEVVGPHRVLGHEPGATFTALIAPAQEAALIEGGHISPIKEKE